MAKDTWVNVNGSFRKVKNIWINIGGVWKQKVITKGNIGGVWKDFIQYLLYFYKDGVQHPTNPLIQNYMFSADERTLTFDADKITMSLSNDKTMNQGEISVKTSSVVDLTPYKTVKMDYYVAISNTSPQIAITTSKHSGPIFVSHTERIKYVRGSAPSVGVRHTLALDVSDLSGQYVIKCGLTAYSSIMSGYVYSLSLE